ncbi:MAG: ATP-binding protein [Kofleriaceae bacterium]
MGWVEANWAYVRAEVARVVASVQRNAAPPEAEQPTPIPPELVTRAPSLVKLCRVFELTAFERDVVTLCLGVEIDPEIGRACAGLSSVGSFRPTLAMALHAFAGGTINALSPSSTLRRHRLVHLVDGVPLTSSPLTLDERITHFLLGSTDLDPTLRASLAEVETAAQSVRTTRHAIAERLATLAGPGGPLILGLTGASIDERRAVAFDIAQRLGARLFRARAQDLPTDATARHVHREKWQREARLLQAMLLVEADADVPIEVTRAACAFLEELEGVVLVSSREPLPLVRSTYATTELARESPGDRFVHWNVALGDHAAELGPELDRVAAQFTLAPSAIQRACLSAASGTGPFARRLWRACREQARPRLEDLATRIEPKAAWDDLVLPADTRAMLESISNHIRHRFEVYERWGFAAKSHRGLGSGALFVGSSGTGKTLAAEVLAREAELDLYHVDLSQVVNKYIGETEKNLRRVFDAAEEGGAILLFDEADSLFGKRGEVEKGTDRYANLEVSYLLQRMESYRGLAILTTNQREALDSAFARRLRFIVPFPFPDVAERISLWQRAFPEAAPIGVLDARKLARLKLPGGHIRNIAVNAAFVAAQHRQPISMAHILTAARAEFLKMERPFPESDVAGWLG